MSCPNCADDCPQCRGNRRALVDRAADLDIVRAHAQGPATPQEPNAGIVNYLRVVLRHVAPARQADLLYYLKDLARSPAFTIGDFLSAIDHLLEGNGVVCGGPISEYGIKARMRDGAE